MTKCEKKKKEWRGIVYNLPLLLYVYESPFPPLKKTGNNWELKSQFHEIRHNYDIKSQNYSISYNYDTKSQHVVLINLLIII